MTTRRWALAWAALCAAFALHVIDEATHDFLSWYNPNALAATKNKKYDPVVRKHVVFKEAKLK